MNTILEMSESVDINTISTNNVSDNISLSYGPNTGNNCNNLGAPSTPITTPEPKSVSNPSGSRSEIHYPGVVNPSRIYDSKRNRKVVRIMTVMAYMFAVSLAAIVLSIYYAFLWNPNMQINNSTHLYTKKTNTNSEDVPLIEDADIDAIESNQVQSQVISNEQPIVSSARLLTPSADNISDSLLTTSEPLPQLTNGQRSVYSSNLSLSLNVEKHNVKHNVPKHLLSNTLRPNDNKIVSNNRNDSKEEKTKLLNETNRTEINVVDNQIEIALNSSQTQN